MKKTPEEERVLERMAPGVLSKDGFLGGDVRPLADIIAADSRAVERLGLSHERIASELDRIYDTVSRQLGRPVELDDNLTGVYRESMGRIPSPWPGEGVFHKGEVEVTDSLSDRKLRFTPLSIHLIREHGFYQGRGSPYRLDPLVVSEMLGINADEKRTTPGGGEGPAGGGSSDGG
jgi:hypothetical protein